MAAPVRRTYLEALVQGKSSPPPPLPRNRVSPKAPTLIKSPSAANNFSSPSKARASDDSRFFLNLGITLSNDSIPDDVLITTLKMLQISETLNWMEIYTNLTRLLIKPRLWTQLSAGNFQKVDPNHQVFTFRGGKLKATNVTNPRLFCEFHYLVRTQSPVKINTVTFKKGLKLDYINVSILSH